MLQRYRFVPETKTPPVWARMEPDSKGYWCIYDEVVNMMRTRQDNANHEIDGLSVRLARVSDQNAQALKERDEAQKVAADAMAKAGRVSEETLQERQGWINAHSQRLTERAEAQKMAMEASIECDRLTKLNKKLDDAHSQTRHKLDEVSRGCDRWIGECDIRTKERNQWKAAHDARVMELNTANDEKNKLRDERETVQKERNGWADAHAGLQKKLDAATMDNLATHAELNDARRQLGILQMAQTLAFVGVDGKGNIVGRIGDQKIYAGGLASVGRGDIIRGSKTFTLQEAIDYLADVSADHFVGYKRFIERA